MHYLYKFLLILLISFLSINFSNSKETAFVDIDFIIANSDIGKKVLSSIDKLNKENLENLKKKNKSLQELEIAIKNKKNVISDDAFKKEVVSFQKKVQKFKEDKNIMVKKFNDFKRKELENVLKQISPIINDYMEENSSKCSIRLKKYFYRFKSIKFN
jgi:outer membrane protein